MTLSEKPHSPCPAPAVLEEYALNRLSAAKAATVAAHLRECSDCCDEVTTLRSEGDRLAEALIALGEAPAGSCRDDECLARYIDNTLPQDERDVSEQHLASCRRCQRRLVALYREYKAVLHEAEHAPGAAETARYEIPQDEGASPAKTVTKTASPAVTATVRNVSRTRNVGIALLGLAGACALAAGLWSGAGVRALRLLAAILLAAGAARILQWRSKCPSSESRSSRFALLGTAGFFALLGSIGVLPAFLWWSAAVAGFSLWLIETSSAAPGRIEREKPESRAEACEVEERKGRSM